MAVVGMNNPKQNIRNKNKFVVTKNIIKNNITEHLAECSVISNNNYYASSSTD